MTVPEVGDGQQRRARLIEEHFLGAPAELTREQVNRASEVELDESRRLWLALGFADVPDGVPSFTEADVDALQLATSLLDDGAVTDAMRLSVTRSLGQAMSHLAETQIEAVSASIAAYPELVALAASDPDQMLHGVLELLAPVEERLQSLLLYAWKRHLTAVAIRAFSSAAGDLASASVGVGFADLVGWTALTREMGEAELADLVTVFETTAFDVVAGAGARVVKVIGDEVMFTAATPTAIAEAGLALSGVFSSDGRTPPVRVGLGWGPALARGGDVFGAVVNIASRCTGLARPGTVLADRGLAAELAEDPAYRLKRLSPQRVRGYSRLEVSVLRRGADAP